jgi:hypothetical protein
MGRISKTNKTTQAEFLNFCCTYWNKQCYVTVKQCKFELTPSVYKKLFDLEIIKVEGSQVHIEFLDEQMDGINNMRQKASLAGKASAKKRNENKRTSTDVQRKPTEKRREEKTKNIYRAFGHLSITKEDFYKLQDEYTKEQIDYILDQIENYKGAKNYKSLYLTCKSWLRKEPKLKQQKGDVLYKNVMNKINNP